MLTYLLFNCRDWIGQTKQRRYKTFDIRKQNKTKRFVYVDSRDSITYTCEYTVEVNMKCVVSSFNGQSLTHRLPDTRALTHAGIN